MTSNVTTPTQTATRVIVTECHTFYSVAAFIIVSLQPVLYVQAAIDEHYHVFDQDYGIKKFEEYWSWTIFPITSGTMAASFVLKPRRNDKKYTSFLLVQALGKRKRSFLLAA